MDKITYIIYPVLGSLLVLLGKYSTKQKWANYSTEQKVVNIKDWVEIQDSVTEGVR